MARKNVSRRNFLSKILKGLPIVVTIETGLPILYDFFESCILNPYSAKDAIPFSKTYLLADLENIYFKKETNRYRGSDGSANLFSIFNSKAYAMRIESVDRLFAPQKYYGFAGYNLFEQDKSTEEFATSVNAFTKTAEIPLLLALSQSRNMPISLRSSGFGILANTPYEHFNFRYDELGINSAVGISSTGDNTTLLVSLDSTFNDLRWLSPWEYSNYTENFNVAATSPDGRSPHLISVNKNVMEVVDITGPEVSAVPVALDIVQEWEEALRDTLSRVETVNRIARSIEPIERPRRIALPKPDSVGDVVTMNRYPTNEGSLNISTDAYVIEVERGRRVRDVRIVAVNRNNDPQNWPRLRFYKETITGR